MVFIFVLISIAVWFGRTAKSCGNNMYLWGSIGVCSCFIPTLLSSTLAPLIVSIIFGTACSIKTHKVSFKSKQTDKSNQEFITTQIIEKKRIININIDYDLLGKTIKILSNKIVRKVQELTIRESRQKYLIKLRAVYKQLLQFVSSITKNKKRTQEFIPTQIIDTNESNKSNVKRNVMNGNCDNNYVKPTNIKVKIYSIVMLLFGLIFTGGYILAFISNVLDTGLLRSIFSLFILILSILILSKLRLKIKRTNPLLIYKPTLKQGIFAVIIFFILLIVNIVISLPIVFSFYDALTRGGFLGISEWMLGVYLIINAAMLLFGTFDRNLAKITLVMALISISLATIIRISFNSQFSHYGVFLNIMIPSLIYLIIILQLVVQLRWKDLPLICCGKDGPFHELIWVSSKGDIVYMKELLMKKTNINGRNFQGYTPLIIAIKNKHYEAVELLLKSGADTSLRDGRSKYYIEYAVKNGDEKIVKLIKEYS